MSAHGRFSAPVVDTSSSPFARLHPLPVNAVRLDDAFWGPRRQLAREVSLPLQHEYLEQTGRLDNFRRAAGQQEGRFEGLYFNDSDVYKWLEATAWTLATDPDPALDQLVDRVTAEISAAQQPDGYLDTYYILGNLAARWTDLPRTHELYCAGHLFQAAVAHFRATGKTTLLDVARRFADCICDTFGPEESGRRPGTDGHPEIEMALVELARVTGERRYLEQALYFLNARGYGYAGGDEYRQDHKPFRELEGMVGHAVRAVYLAAGAADLYAETGDPTLRETLERLWTDMVTAKLYVTGGIGARHEGESFGKPYELPNERAYAETCAAIGNVMWNWRMLLLTGEARFADLMELALYNGVLAGYSLDGRAYFYVNPLADDGSHRRQPWFSCACCPPNVARLLASLPGYFYSASGQGVWVHLYAQGTAHITLPGGQQVRLQQHTRYPWEGGIEIEVDGAGEFSLFLRVPAWCEDGASVRVNGQTAADPVPGRYVEVRRAWQRGDTVELSLPMPARRLESHPYVAENAGRVALARGPLIYCVEQADNPGVELRDLVLPDRATISTEDRPDLLGGVVALRARARLVPPGPAWSGTLYRAVRRVEDTASEREVELVAIPYYAWANREPGRMQVWLRRSPM